MVVLRLVADGELGSVGRNAMIVIAARGKTGIDSFGFAPGYRQSQDMAIAVEYEKRTVAAPVGGFEVFRSDIRHSPVAGIGRYCFQRAIQRGLGRGGAGVANSTFENTAFSMTSLS